MDAGQITIMPPTGGNAPASAVPVTDTAGKQPVSIGLFREMLGQNLRGLLSAGDQCCQGQPTKAEATSTATEIPTALTKKLVEQDVSLTDPDPTALNQLAAYAQLAVLQASLPVQQQQQTATATTVETTELPVIGDVTAVRSNTQVAGADLAGGLPMAADAAQSEQTIAQAVISVPKELTGMQSGEKLQQPELLGHSEAVVTAKPAVMPSKPQTATSNAATEPVQQPDAGLKAEPGKQMLKSQDNGQEVAQKAPEAQPVVQEMAGATKNTATVVQQPVRFAQHPDVVAAAAGSEGQKNAASDQQNQGSQLMAKSPKELVMQGEQVTPDLVEEAVTTFRLPEQHAVPMHMGQPVVVATDAATAEVVKNAPQELIGRQVTDRLASHEIKQGNDQISLKLSPENLGNLQLNMRMDDNRLKLEIVAETRGVRDALLQQADELKETLARQNIKVDSFNVTTGNNGNQSQQQSADWRQMAPEQRQYQPQYASSRTSGTAAEGFGTSMQYFAPQYQSTLDVRF
jgi:flagellar hook-length control protein FliK